MSGAAKAARRAGLLPAILLAGCSVVGIRSGTEQPSYTVQDRVGALEIRAYPVRLAAETTIASDEYGARSAGFRRLAGFIFGGNHGGSQIGMTAPVAQAAPPQAIAMTAPVSQSQAGPGQWTIRFFMPARYTAATLPQPNDAAIRIVTVPAETVGVYRYSGSISPAAIAAGQAELLRLLQGSGWVARGEPVTWFYDPPWTLAFLRRNEAAAVVARPG